jgi:hypothetical protein
MGNRPTVKNRHAVKYSLLCAFTVLTMLVLLSFPASATAVLDIRVTESINLTDEFDGTTLTQGTLTGEGEINITNMLTTELYDISLNFSEGGTSGWEASPVNGVYLDTTGDGYVTVHINSLVEKGSAIITYSCTGSRPVIFSESYNTSKIFAGGSINVSLTLENNASSDITGIQLIKTAADNDTDSTADFNFSDASADVGTPSITGGNVLTWDLATLDTGTTATLNFTASDNDLDSHNSGDFQSSTPYYLGNSTLQFTINDGSESGSGVGLNEDPTATTSNFEISLQKEQLSPADGGDGNDWGFTPTIENTDTEEISFSISSVNLYVTNSSALQDTSAVNSTSYTSQTISNVEPWTKDEWKIYDFPEPVPVGWIDVDLSVDFSGAQLSKAYSTTNGTYEFIEKIYIINGYLVEAKKSISKNESSDDQYDITLWVHNLGNLETPPNVYVYDIVPNEFEMVYNETDPDGHMGVTSPIQGDAYWWNVGPLEPEGTPGNQTYINYTVQGTGTYSLTELFILGIDPSYSLNMQSTPVLRTGARIVSGSGVKSVISVLMMSSLLLGMVGLRRKKRAN